MMRALVVICLVAACGDNVAPAVADAASCGDSGCVVACSAAFTGNFEETSSSPKACPLLMPGAGDSEGHTMIDFLVPSPALGTSLGVQIDLGATPTVGGYASESTRLWNAIAIKNVPIKGACVFTAGAMSVPTGSFRLHLDGLDLASVPASATAHGLLTLSLFVLPRTTEQGEQTDCGANTTETMILHF